MISKETDNEKFIIQLQIEEKLISMMVDTGAALSTISCNKMRKLGLRNKINPTNVKMKTYSVEIINLRGFIFVKVIYKGQEFFGTLYIINQEVDAIFAREWIREVKLNLANNKMINMIDNERLDQVLVKYSDIFQEVIDLIPYYKRNLSLKKNYSPIFIKPRQVPFSLKNKFELKLNRLEKNGIFTKINFK